jgi:transaldolase/glucose-6-phosphate isomerase
MAGVASFFISRIDTLVDSQIDEKLKKTTNSQEEALLKSLKGKVAIANGKLTYQRYQKIFSGPRWEALASRGAQTQRVLWASTSTKNPEYRDVMYVEELIGPDTVDTMPPATVDAFRDHGRLRNSLTENVAGAKKVMEDLEKAGISMKEVTTKLTTDGVKLFADAFNKLLHVVEKSVAQKGKNA